MTATGGYFPDREQPALAVGEREAVARFHEIYYDRWRTGADTINLSWLGHEVVKCPLDLWMYQELIVRTRPDLVVETGTHRGGSALFMAAVFDQLDHGEVVSIDMEEGAGRPVHPRVAT